MIYTLGSTNNYERFFQEMQVVFKKVGGSVWETRDAVEQYLKSLSVLQRSRLSVYGVEADWDSADTLVEDGSDWRSLSRNAKLIKLS